MLLSVVIFTASANAQTADEIVTKHLAAIGGVDSLNKVTTILREGSLEVQGNEVALIMTTSCGIGYRMDISVMGMTGYQLATPKEGWSYMPFQGQTEPTAMNSEQLATFQENYNCANPFLNYANNGSTLELLGTEKAEGKDCYKLKLTDKKQVVKIYFLDKTTYMLLKRINKIKEGDSETVFDNYKVVNGVKMPYSLTNTRGTVTITKITINGKVDETIFKPGN